MIFAEAPGEAEELFTQTPEDFAARAVIRLLS